MIPLLWRNWSGYSSVDEIKKIEEVLEDMRPNIQMDGGDIKFVSYIDGVVALRLQGTCASCPLSLNTLKLGIEERLKEQIPDIVEVISVDEDDPEEVKDTGPIDGML